MTTLNRKRVRLNKEENRDKLTPPSLISLQVDSFNQFIKNGIKEELNNISPIVGNGGKLKLELLDTYTLNEPEYSFEECQIREITYSSSLKVPVRLTNNETGEVIEQEAMLSDIPIMSRFGTFLINGAERVIVSQFVRSPGVYFRTKPSTITSAQLYVATIIPNRGAWLEFESERDNTIFANVNKLKKKVPVTLLLSALGITEKEIFSNIKHKEYFEATLEKYPLQDQESALVELNKKLRPGDPVTVEGARNALNSLFFDDAKYDLSAVGRYRLNRRLSQSEKNTKTHLVNQDILSLLNNLLLLIHGEGIIDDIDHLGNRRIRSVGEQLQKQIRIGFLD